jgi:hypothetical protein
MFLKARRKAVLVPIKLRDLVEKFNAHPLSAENISPQHADMQGAPCM